MRPLVETVPGFHGRWTNLHIICCSVDWCSRSHLNNVSKNKFRIHSKSLHIFSLYFSQSTLFIHYFIIIFIHFTAKNIRLTGTDYEMSKITTEFSTHYQAKGKKRETSIADISLRPEIYINCMANIVVHFHDNAANQSYESPFMWARKFQLMKYGNIYSLCKHMYILQSKPDFRKNVKTDTNLYNVIWLFSYVVFILRTRLAPHTKRELTGICEAVRLSTGRWH